ncbi:MAG: DUF4230 domain-containing protein [Clostridia bacterium]|nr:DUF4230 domain-containing protein [Clostridia bacterium]
MKRIIISIILLDITLFICSSCSKKEETKAVEPHITQMRSICELATMECYYHNVAKFKQEDVEGILLWKKDKHFWIEYSGVVKVGIEASLLDIKVDGDKVTISIPPAKVLGIDVDETRYNEDSIVVADGSADVTGEDQTKALKEAQKNMKKEAKNDKALLASAQDRAKTLLEEYVNNIGEAVGKNYKITWKEIK